MRHGIGGEGKETVWGGTSVDADQEVEAKMR